MPLSPPRNAVIASARLTRRRPRRRPPAPLRAERAHRFGDLFPRFSRHSVLPSPTRAPNAGPQIRQGTPLMRRVVATWITDFSAPPSVIVR